MKTQDYLAWLFLASVAGGLWESMYNAQYLPPFLPIYGFGTVGVIAVRQAVPSTPRLPLAVVLGILLSVFECISGHWTYHFWGPNPKFTWNYEGKQVFGLLPFCNGYASVSVTVLWILAAYLVLLLFDASQR